MNVRTVIKIPLEDNGDKNTRFSVSVLTALLEVWSEESVQKVDVCFTNVAAFRFATEGQSKPYIKAAYDGVAEVLDSTWVADLAEPTLWPFLRRHFAIYVEGVGLYEILGEEVRISLSHREDAE